MVINFICRASKADKSGQSPLEVSIIINGVRRYVHLDRKIKAADFNVFHCSAVISVRGQT